MQFYHSNLLNFVTNVTHTFTTKNSGNLAFHVNDSLSNVEKNHTLLAKELGYDKSSLIHMKQIHSSIVHVVNKEDNFTNPKECDALVTNKKNIPLMVMVADCSPILLYDKLNDVIAVAHAGRQGAFKNIIKNTLDTMKNEFESDPENILVSIGPSIGQCCYEVGEEIYAQALSIGLEYALEKKEDRYYLSVGKILYKQLVEASIKKENFEISTKCTCCNSKTYNSYRAEPQTGRFAGVILLT